jgi:hypothetical protein
MVGGLVLLVLAIAIPVVMFMGGGGGGAGGDLGPNAWTTPALRPTQQHDKNMDFGVGDQVEITAKGNRGRMGDPAFDVDLHVLGPNGIPVAGDASIGPDSRVNFRAPLTGSYTIRVINVSGRGNNAISSTVNVKVTKANPPAGGEKKAEIPQGNKGGFLPVGGNKDGAMKAGGGGDDGNKTWNAQLTLRDPPDLERPGSRHRVFPYRMKAGNHYTIRMISNTPMFDPYLRLRNPTNQTVEQDDDSGGGQDGLDAQIEFDCTQDGLYQIVATSYSAQTSLGNFTLTVTPRPK